MTATILALAEAHIPAVIAGCTDWQDLAQSGPPYWRPRSAAELRRKITATAGPQPGIEYSFVVEDNHHGLVGECSVHAIDWRNRLAQVGVCIWNPDNRQRGYGGSAVEFAIDWAFGYLGLVRLEAWIVDGNDASLALFRRVGFVHEGVLRGRYLCAGKRLDMHVLALMASS